MKIAGALFIVIGLVVAVTSFVLLQKGQKMTLFMYFGVAMAVYGAWRLYIDASSGQTKERSETHRRDLSAQLPEMRHNSEIPRICSVCRTKNHPRANFCGYCGNRL